MVESHGSRETNRRTVEKVHRLTAIRITEKIKSAWTASKFETAKPNHK